MSKAPQKPVFGGEEAGIASFEGCRVAILPAPMELTVSYGSGAAKGPEAILLASDHLEYLDEQTGARYWNTGDVHTLDPVSIPEQPEAAVAAITAAAQGVVDAGKLLITLGGEHTVTAGAVRAVASRHEGLGLLIVDAHLDLRDNFHGDPWSHACVMRRVLEEHHLPLTYCGVRALAVEEAPFIAEHDIRPIYAEQVEAGGSWISEVVSRLPEKVYLSFDVDALDPAVLPGTGAPEPAGLSYRQGAALMEAVARQRTIVAADFVELAPIPGQQVSEFTAARLVAKLIGSVLS